VEKVQRGESSSKKSAQLFQNTMENSVRNGGILLLEDLSSEIDPGIDQIVSKAIFKEEGIHKIVLGNRAVDYDLNFRLFLTTKMSNPHFLPEVTIKLSVINFTVTFDGLDDQLLAEVVQNLEPEVERKRDQLVIEISASIDDQYSIQSSILTALAESNQETILDNEKLIETLRISKTKSM
jgi:dynein heavy chain